MRLQGAAVGDPKAEPQVRSKSKLTQVPETELDIRIKNLNKLLESVCCVLGHESFAGQPEALDSANDLRLKIKATDQMFRVARLLSEPARSSVLRSVGVSVNDLEHLTASRFGIDLV